MPTPPASNHRRRRRPSHRRIAYDAYLASRAWRATRKQWYAAELTCAGTAPSCLVCGRRWTLKAGHLHHLTDMRLGREEREDLVPLCARHHHALHAILDTSPGWRALDLATATAGIITRLRSQHRAARHTRNGGAPYQPASRRATRPPSRPASRSVS